MKKLLLALFLLTAVSISLADSRVFTLVNPDTDAVLQSLRTTYGDKIHAEIVQGRLLVVGSKQQLDEIGALLVKFDPAPRALHLTLSEQPPADANENAVTYSTDKGGYTIDTIEGALVTIDYRQFAQQVSGFAQQSNGVTQQFNGASQQSNSFSQQPNGGWWITLENVPTQINTLSLQIKIEGGRRAIVLVGYTKEENQQRRVFGNTVVGNLGAWIPLLPRPVNLDENTISSGPKAGEQLYLRVEKAR